MSGEFELISRIAARISPRSDVVLGIGDDGAIVRPPVGRELVIVTDTLNRGVHFPEDTSAFDVGWKALAVNLSDLAAMGATPAWCTLALSLPAPDDVWLDACIDGFLALAVQHDIALVGGDTTLGPLSLTVTACGTVAAGTALRRDAAKVGDDIWMSGTLGDAALALREVLQNKPCADELRSRLDRPSPRCELGRALAGIAHACIDVSDGVLQDLGHVCVASGVGAEVRLDALPASEVLAVQVEGAKRWRLQTAGDDYELCFSADPTQHSVIEALSNSLDVALTRIGRVVSGQGVRAIDAGGGEVQLPSSGYQHFG
ncbi:thiamine-phosphate kinase [Solilutibacter silvestris]|uniref:Thiamine-monophosphate kinase n=1 Tax=Solilutibacter silvestris TaxID=1645665 RepID=A0A2K1Q2K0_9GAMM|nr:thiamine-phosphate kinase [Lysobacter silvestris]PNS09269.1 thiL: thiamine-monophosphate kinase [Lysobacter silvestris]